MFFVLYCKIYILNLYILINDNRRVVVFIIWNKLHNERDKVMEKIKKPKNYTKSQITTSATTILVTLFLAAIVFISYYFIVEKPKEQQIKDMTEQSLLKTNELESCKVEMSSLSKRLEGIKNNDDLLKRDIFLYIDRKFQMIPRTVALDIAEQILIVSKQENISPELIVGIVEIESSFNPMSKSNKKARGLMQVMPEWVPKLGLKHESDLYDIDTSISIGVKVLKIHISEQKGSINKGLYYYVNKDSKYVSDVYAAIGRFVTFRSTINNNQDKVDVDDPSDEEDKNEEVKQNEENTKQ